MSESMSESKPIGPLFYLGGQTDLGESLAIYKGEIKDGDLGDCAMVATVHNFDEFPCLEEDQVEEIDAQARALADLFVNSPGALALLKKAQPIVAAEAVGFHPATQRYRDLSALADQIKTQIARMEGQTR